MELDEKTGEDLTALEAYVLDQLAGGMRPQTVMFEVAKRQGWHWSQAETFVNRVAKYQSEAIRKRQSPLLRVMSALLLAAGSLVLAVTLFRLADYVHTLSLRRSDLSFLALLLSVIGIFVVGELPQLIWGIALLFAGIIGWRKTLPPRTVPEFDYDLDDEV